MELVVKKEGQDCWDFQVIPVDFEGHFVNCVLSDYEYSLKEAVEEAVLVIPSKRPFDLRVLIEGFEEAYMIYESAIEVDMFPDLEWDRITESEQADISEQVAGEAYEYDHLFLADVRKILDTFQLFYAICQDGNSDKGSLAYVHCPLQEVW